MTEIIASDPDCGCSIEGHGTHEDPIRVWFCSLHDAALAMHAALRRMPCSCEGIWRPDEAHLGSCPMSIAKEPLKMVLYEMPEANA